MRRQICADRRLQRKQRDLYWAALAGGADVMGGGGARSRISRRAAWFLSDSPCAPGHVASLRNSPATRLAWSLKSSSKSPINAVTTYGARSDLQPVSRIMSAKILS